MRIRAWLWLAAGLASVKLAFAGNILIIHPFFAGSHVLTLRVLAEEMIRRGHEVTVVRWKDSLNYPASQNPGVTELLLGINNPHNTVPFVTPEDNGSFIVPQELLWNEGESPSLSIDPFITVGAYCDNLLGRKDLIDGFRRQQFNMAIVDLLYNECGLHLAEELSLPVVGYWAFTFTGGESQLTAAFSPPSTVPFLTTGLPEDMTFMQRLKNFVYAMCSHAVMQVQMGVSQHHACQHLKAPTWPALLLANLSGALINTHPAVDTPRLLPPSFLQVGGMQIRPYNDKPLPQEVRAWVEGAGAGVVVFSLGFTFTASVVPPRLIQDLLAALGRLEQRVVMRLKGYDGAIPANVLLTPWLPQQELLGHNKTVLFFTHFGMHGVLEALYHGVPMVGIPIFCDQPDVLKRLEERGVAKGLTKQSSQEEVYQAMMEVLNDNRYGMNARRLSDILRDRLTHPLDEAAWLVESVMRTGGHHLKARGHTLSWLQYFGVDVLATLILVPVLVLGVFIKCCVYFMCTSPKSKKTKTS